MSRRRPPPFLTADVVDREWLSSRLVRVTLEGEDLRGLAVSEPASSVRVLLPEPERPDVLEIPDWDGNRFVRAGGGRPLLRTLTPRYHDADRGRLQLDVVVHGEGAASAWASGATAGRRAAVSGPARGYSVDPDAAILIVGGDETAIPAIGQILEALPATVDVSVHVETATIDARPPLPPRPRCRVHWVGQSGPVPGQALAGQLSRVDLPAGARLWAAGEAASMQRVRQALLAERGIPRNQVTIRGYWKHGRRGEDALPEG
jgi:NADPH-dependent ferric siderophore reductase